MKTKVSLSLSKTAATRFDKLSVTKFFISIRNIFCYCKCQLIFKSQSEPVEDLRESGCPYSV